jgi:hypothetical protein
MVHMNCTMNNFMHFLVHSGQSPVHAPQYNVPYDPFELLYVPVLVHGVPKGHGLHGRVHPEQPPVYTDQFYECHDPLKLLHVPVLVHGVHGLCPKQLHARLSASKTTSGSC